jgi:hypothetical protein
MEEYFILTDRALTLRRYKYEALCLDLRLGELRELRKVVEIWKHEIESRESSIENFESENPELENLESRIQISERPLNLSPVSAPFPYWMTFD